VTDPKFVHLRIHSDYSMADGVAKVGKIVSKINEMGMPTMAITDLVNLCGLVKYYRAAHGKGVKPIIGADLWVVSDEFNDEPWRITILCKDNVGYNNLTLLISKAYLRGKLHHKAVIDKAWLIEFNQGLIILSGGREGDVGLALLKGNEKLAQECLSFYQSHFPNNYYLELLRTGRANEEQYLHLACEFASQTNIPVVATNEVMFLESRDFDAHEVRVAIHDGFGLADPRRPKRYSDQQYLRSEQEMCELFSDIPSALENSVEIAKRCNATVVLDKIVLPDYPTGDLEIEDFLVKVSVDGLEERLEFLFPEEEERERQRPAYEERLHIELGVVNKMGFPGYFLIVMEFIQWSKDNDVPVGPGRGSGAGSLVAYALKITDLDPLEYDLLFERFLNPERVSMPDFDVDFCMEGRDRVIDHVAQLYGRDAVSQIITFGTMAAKAVVRDVGRVMGQPYGFVERLTKLIPAEPGMTLTKAWEVEPQLEQLYKADDDVRDLIDMARRLEGTTRNAGKHAGGVVISPTTITDFAPLYCDDEGNNPVTQFDKNDVETAGLVKFDFLGLRTLTIIKWALDPLNIARAKQDLEPIAIESIPLEDPASFAMLKRSETTAVFQLESRGMKELISRLLPDTFEDIIALVALFRPGPLQSGMVDNFIDRKHGREDVSYPDIQWQHESLKETLEPTYGIILYQEQVMQIAQVLSGYTLGGADMLRRAMGKKKPEEMAKQRSTFEEGAVENGIDGELAMKIFDLVEKFAGYGFNKSHSAAYALVSYQTLWLKCHHPAYFMAAVMSADMDNTDKIVTLVDECDRMKLVLHPPDVNSGEYKFSVNENEEIIYGIGAIKGVGEGPVEAILEARAQGGPFKDLFDFCGRIDTKKISKRIFEKLIKAGALDQLGPHRASMMASLPAAVKAAVQHAKDREVGQHDLFGLLASHDEDVSHEFVDIMPWPDKIWLEGERETLGLYLTGHPINQYLPELKHYTRARLKDIIPTARGQVVKAAGLVIASRVMITKRGSKMGIMTIDDKSGRLEAMLYSETLEKYQDLLQKDKILVLEGEVSFDDFSGGNRMSVKEVYDIANARERFASALELKVEQQQVDKHFFSRFNQVMAPFQYGALPVNIFYSRAESTAKLELGIQWRVTPDDELLDNLRMLLGSKQVRLKF
jgi:DNA polymerase-3 subunit alpha